MEKVSLLPLKWTGGLHTYLAPHVIKDDELSACSNAITRDGTIRLDQRYALLATAASGTTQGSGWGKYGTGANSNVYAAVIGNDLYYSDSTGASWSKMSGSVGQFTSGNWFFQQFAGYMYLGHSTGGIYRFPFGSLGVSGSGIALPAAPANAPGIAFDVTDIPHASDFTGGTVALDTGTGSVSTSGDIITVKTTAAGQCRVSITYKTSGPDRRPDWTYRDIVRTYFQTNYAYSIPELSFENGGTTYTVGAPVLNNGSALTYRITNVARSNRGQVTKVFYDFVAPSGTAQFFIKSPTEYGVWLPTSTGTTTTNTRPVQDIVYAYTFYNSTTGLESPMSPEATYPAANENFYGEWLTITGATSAESGVDKVRFYRVVTEGGVKSWYRLTEVANTGTPTFLDKYPLDIVKTYTSFTPAVLPTACTALTAWQSHLVIANGPIVYISRLNTPLSFEDISGAADVLDPARGLTFYADDRRSEQVQALWGQDNLYIVTDYSVRAMVGNGPDNWRLNKLPNSEGACGPRASYPYKNGILVLTPSGRLVYHSTDFADPVDIGYKLRARIGDSGMEALVSTSAVVAVRPGGEIDVRGPSGQYFTMDVNGNWRGGTHTHPTFCTNYVSGQGIRWFGTNGKFYEGGKDAYQDDAGTAVTWSITTKKHLMPRSRVMNTFWGDSTGNPSLLVNGEDGSYPVLTKKGDHRNMRASVQSSGWGLSFTISGDKNVVVEECRIELLPISQAKER